jgi:hypothetical protein
MIKVVKGNPPIQIETSQFAHDPISKEFVGYFKDFFKQLSNLPSDITLISSETRRMERFHYSTHRRYHITDMFAWEYVHAVAGNHPLNDYKIVIIDNR